MPAIPYKALDGYQPKELLDAIAARRGPGGVINLDRMLLHSAPFTEGWNTFFGKVRGSLKIDNKLRELATCAVAKLNDANYEFVQHKPYWMRAGGTEAQATALTDVDAAAADQKNFDAVERAVLRLVVEMTRTVKVAPETLGAARKALPDEQQLVELIGVIAAVNMVARFVIATGVEIEEA